MFCVVFVSSLLVFTVLDQHTMVIRELYSPREIILCDTNKLQLYIYIYIYILLSELVDGKMDATLDFKSGGVL